MDWLNWENAAYLIAIILGGMVTMVGCRNISCSKKRW